MLDLGCIVDAVIEVLTAQYPTIPVFKDYKSTEFVRPSLFVALEEAGMLDLGCNIMKVTPKVRVDVILERNTQGYADSAELAQMGTAVMSLFIGQYIAVEARTVWGKSAKAKGSGKDYISVFLDLEYKDSHQEEEETDELMDALKLS